MKTYDHQLQIHYFEADEMIIEEKTKVSNLYLVIDGQANVTPSSATGKIGFLEFVLPMDIIGDMEFFTDSLYFHSVVAHTDCTYLAIPITLISTQLTTNGVFYHFVCRNMTSKMKRTSMRYSNLSTSFDKYLRCGNKSSYTISVIVILQR